MFLRWMFPSSRPETVVEWFERVMHVKLPGKVRLDPDSQAFIQSIHDELKKIERM